MDGVYPLPHPHSPRNLYSRFHHYFFGKKSIKLSNPVLSISNGLDTAHSSSGLPSLPLIKEKVKIHLRLPGHDILAIVTTASME